MIKRATIIIKGTVQIVGFRDKIRKIAKTLNITGQAENLGNGSIRIVCEGPESNIRKLLQLLNEENGLSNVRAIHPRFSDAWGSFRGFRIIREKDFEQAVYRRLDAGVSYLKDIKNGFKRLEAGNSEVKSGINGVKSGINGVKSGFKGVKSGINDVRSEIIGVKSSIQIMDSHMGGHFRRLDKKYDSFGANMAQVARDLHDIKDDLRTAVSEMKRGSSPKG